MRAGSHATARTSEWMVSVVRSPSPSRRALHAERRLHRAPRGGKVRRAATGGHRFALVEHAASQVPVVSGGRNLVAQPALRVAGTREEPGSSGLSRSSPAIRGDRSRAGGRRIDARSRAAQSATASRAGSGQDGAPAHSSSAIRGAGGRGRRPAGSALGAPPEPTDRGPEPRRAVRRLATGLGPGRRSHALLRGDAGSQKIRPPARGISARSPSPAGADGSTPRAAPRGPPPLHARTRARTRSREPCLGDAMSRKTRQPARGISARNPSPAGAAPRSPPPSSRTGSGRDATSPRRPLPGSPQGRTPPAPPPTAVEPRHRGHGGTG